MSVEILLGFVIPIALWAYLVVKNGALWFQKGEEGIETPSAVEDVSALPVGASRWAGRALGPDRTHRRKGGQDAERA